MALPSGFTTRIQAVQIHDKHLEEAFAPMSVTLSLEDEIDLSRGDMLVKPANQPESTQDIDVMICWLNSTPLQVGGKYAVKHTTQDLRCIIKEVNYKVDINTLHRMNDDCSIGLNDIGRISIQTTQPLHCDPYNRNRATGSLIIIDEYTNETVAAGMIL